MAIDIMKRRFLNLKQLWKFKHLVFIYTIINAKE